MKGFSLRMLSQLCLVLLVALASARGAAQGNAQTTRRFAVVVGANQGGKERPTLRFAQRDAQTVVRVLEQLGGVDHQDRVLLLEPSAEQLVSALRELGQRTRAAAASGQRTELLFYYSGHSDERGLLLGEQRLLYRALRDGLSQVEASVHVGVLDSCASGALTRLKGGERRAPFLLDSSNAVEGHAFLTSASADEGAQESDRVGASFFTHYLVSGLRGAADYSGDGRVTLNEAYRFAFDETLARTEDTHAGPQHAAYDIQLVGTGDLVMTDLRTPSAALRLPKDLAGRFYVRDLSGNLVVELMKPRGRVVELALDAQTYQVLRDDNGQLSRATVSLPESTTTEINSAQFAPIEGERNRLRGDEPEPRDDCKLVPFGVGIVPNVSTNSRYLDQKGPDGRRLCIKNTFNAHLLWGEADQVEGVAISFGGTRMKDLARGAQVALGINIAKQLEGAQLAVGANYVESGRGAQLSVGPSIAAKHFEGAQGGLINLGAEVHGAQLGLLNGAYQLRGAQLGLLNLSESTRGAQLGLANVNTQKSEGLRAGLLNFTGRQPSSGFELGLANVAAGSLRGGQVGLVNYADRASGQFGLLSITRQGGVHALLFTSDALPLQLGVRFEADYTYSSLLVGMAPASGKDTLAGGFGFGGKIPLPARLWLEPGFDVQYLAFDSDFGSRPSTLGRLHLSLRYQLFPHLSFFGGPVYQAVVHEQRADHGRWPGLLSGDEVTKEGQKTQVLTSLGFVAGVSL